MHNWAVERQRLCKSKPSIVVKYAIGEITEYATYICCNCDDRTISVKVSQVHAKQWQCGFINVQKDRNSWKISIFPWRCWKITGNIDNPFELSLSERSACQGLFGLKTRRRMVCCWQLLISSFFVSGHWSCSMGMAAESHQIGNRVVECGSHPLLPAEPHHACSINCRLIVGWQCGLHR